MTGSGGVPAIGIVIPTVGRDCLYRLLGVLRRQLACQPDVELIVVDDRPGGHAPLPVRPGARVVYSGGAGPAAARNAGWRAARAGWVAFLDDDVIPAEGWLRALRKDLGEVPDAVGGVQGRLLVPPPADRPDDWQRETAGLASAGWITADMAYRRAALVEVGGFDERFPRAYREDAELAYRVRSAGWTLVRGGRRVAHPPRPESVWVSLRRQRGNADDALLRRMYGRDWHDLLGAPRGRRRWHAAGTGLAAVGAAALVTSLLCGGGRTRPGRVAGGVALTAGVGWAGSVAEFAAHRVRRAPGSLRHPFALAVTSAAIPPAAVAAWCSGWWRHRGARPLPAPGPDRRAPAGTPASVGEPRTAVRS